ncbi:MAG: aa3-type cytochrome oxidase subunit CtaJ [Geodermatophilaceae bacterium]
MSVVQTVLVYVGLPALGFAVIAVLVYAGGGGRSPRYRPGRGWSHDDVWYVPRPLRSSGPTHRALESGGSSRSGPGPRRTARGGASGTW